MLASSPPTANPCPRPPSPPSCLQSQSISAKLKPILEIPVSLFLSVNISLSNTALCFFCPYLGTSLHTNGFCRLPFCRNSTLATDRLHRYSTDLSPFLVSLAPLLAAFISGDAPFLSLSSEETSLIDCLFTLGIWYGLPSPSPSFQKVKS